MLWSLRGCIRRRPTLNFDNGSDAHLSHIPDTSRDLRKSSIIGDPPRLQKMLCTIVLAFIAVSMLVSPVLDFFIVENRKSNWTVTMSIFAFSVASLPFFAIALLSLKSRGEKLFLQCAAGLFLYAALLTGYSATELFYPFFGLASALCTTLVGVLFYVAVRDNLISPSTVFNFLAFASVFVIVPLLLVQIDTERFAQLAEEFTATRILYGYENPRAVGWASTVFLSMLAAYMATQPKESRIHPLALFSIVVAATTLFWSGSRGGLIALTLSLSIVIFVSQTRNLKGIIAVVLSVAAGAAISLFTYLPNASYGIFSRISQNLEQENVAALSSGRIDLWLTTVSHILERPFIGYGYLPHKTLEGFSHGSAHNLVLDAWLWFGVIVGSIILLCGLLLWTKAFAFFRRANDPYVAALFCVTTALLLYSMISGPYARTFPLLLFAIPAGVILGQRSSTVD